MTIQEKADVLIREKDVLEKNLQQLIDYFKEKHHPHFFIDYDYKKDKIKVTLIINVDDL